MATQSLAELTREELPLQSASVDMEGGNMPSCMTLFDRYLACYCQFLPFCRYLLTLTQLCEAK
jgi:hypothetical protein